MRQTRVAAQARAGVPVTVRQVAKRSWRVSRYSAAVRRWRRGRKWLAMGVLAVYPIRGWILALV